MTKLKLLGILSLITFASTACNPISSLIPSSSSSPSPQASGTLSSSTGTNIDLTTVIKTKAELINAYKCAIEIAPNDVAKGQLQASLIVINALAENYFVPTVMASYISVLNAYNLSGCNFSTGITTSTGSSSSNTGVITGSGLLVSNASFSVYGCDAESTLKSKTGKSINVNFINNTGKNINIYWLDMNGKRVSYKNNLAPSGKHPQQTFVTHPWLITDTSGNCLGVYLFNESTDISITGDLSTYGQVVSGNTGSSTSTGTGSVSSSVSVGSESLLSQANNLTRLPGVTVNVSSEYSNAWNKSRLIDGNLNTSWFTKVNDAANKGTKPYIEIVFPSPVNIKGVNLKGNREYKDGYDIFEGNLIVNSISGTSNYNVQFPEPNRDFDIIFSQPINSVTSVKFEITKDESIDPGLAEFEVVAAN